MTKVKVKGGPKYKKNDSVDKRVRKMLHDERFKKVFESKNLEREAVKIAKQRERRLKK